MAKETYYFQHDYEPTTDFKISALIAKFGAVGYGVFWRFVEMMHSESLHVIPKKQYIYSAVAQQMLTSVEQVSKIVEFCIIEVELFKQNETHFWSERVLRNIKLRTEISEKRSQAGKSSAESKRLKQLELQAISTSVEQVPTSVQQKATKKRKGKEIKVNPIPSIGDFLEYCKTIEGVDYPSMEFKLKKKYESWIANEWKDGKDNPISNWKTKILNVIPYMLTDTQIKNLNSSTGQKLPCPENNFHCPIWDELQAKNLSLDEMFPYFATPDTPLRKEVKAVYEASKLMGGVTPFMQLDQRHPAKKLMKVYGEYCYEEPRRIKI